ncbi:hypothetical protein M408DRAFT_232993 [Serendipita vermifera MAFF 305830]|uniref:Uncharacterized protein n=1 Tax=Serendipita vermifera MAFF 305830 TaxID=933852 RepID=A0A0C2X4U1_SERVB|nr:hypothetical protein M408DRAFT_232993 [Serendipita vermifera MAFF 305830]
MGSTFLCSPLDNDDLSTFHASLTYGSPESIHTIASAISFSSVFRSTPSGNGQSRS